MKTRKTKKTNKTEMIMIVVSTLFLVWIGASFIDVIANNMGSYTYAPWNAFELFIRFFN